MVRGPAVRVAPGTPPDAAGGDASGGHLELVQTPSAARIVDARRAGQAAPTAHPEVAAAVDRESVEAHESRGHQVGEQALRDATAVELHAGRARDSPPPPVHGDLAPAAERA